MERHETVDDMWRDALASIFAVGERSDDTQEVLGWSGQLVADAPTLLGNKRRALSHAYASAELLWYLSGEDSVEMISRYAPQYVKFAEVDGRAHGAYGKRLSYGEQIGAALALLRGKCSSRQCVLSLWRPSDLGVAVRDLPCTLTWQLLIRQGLLHMIVSMRSNDVWLGMPYDVYAFTCFQKIMSVELGVGVGTYTHHVGSMHAYDRNRTAAFEALSVYDAESVRVEHSGLDNLHSAGLAVKMERSWRKPDQNARRDAMTFGPLFSRTLEACHKHLFKES